MCAFQHALLDKRDPRGLARAPRPASAASNSVDFYSKQSGEDRFSQPSPEQAAKVKSVYEQVLKLRSKRQSQQGQLRDFQEVNPL